TPPPGWPTPPGWSTPPPGWPTPPGWSTPPPGWPTPPGWSTPPPGWPTPPGSSPTPPTSETPGPINGTCPPLSDTIPNGAAEPGSFCSQPRPGGKCIYKCAQGFIVAGQTSGLTCMP